MDTTRSLTRGNVRPATADAVAVSRIKTLAALLVLTAVPSVVLGLLWQGPEQTNQLYSHSEIAPDRELWWGVLIAFAVLLSMSVPLQALATMLLVRTRGSRWATVGGVLMWIGAGVQAAGLAGWAAAYFFPTDPAVAAAAGRAVIEAANADEAHLIALVPIGMGLVVVGTVLQCVGLFRAKVVPAWLPVAALFVMLTFVVPGYGMASLIASVPMAAAAVGLAYHALRSVRPPHHAAQWATWQRNH